MPLEVADRPRDAAPKKKREPLVPIPPDAPKLPDLKEKKEKIDALHAKAKEYRAEIEKLRQDAEDRKKAQEDPRQKLIQEKKELQREKTELSKLMTDLRVERNELQKKVNDIRQKAREQERDIRAMNKELGSLITVDQIDKKIKELEFKLESGSTSSIKGEKALMKEIKQLEAARDKANNMGSKALAVVSQREDEEECFKKAQEKQALIDANTAKISVLLQKMDAKQDELNAFQGTNDAKKAREQRDELSAKMTECYKKMDEVKADFEKKRQAYDEWKVDYDKKCDEVREKRRKEREEQDRVRAEKHREHELQLAAIKRLNPHEEEINNAESLIGYLKAKIAFQARDERKNEAKNSAAAHFDPTQAASGKGMMVLKKDEADDWLFGSSKNKKAAKPKPKPVPKPAVDQPVKSKPVSHNSEKLRAFAALGVREPHNTVEVKEVIEELKKKKAHWESFKKTEKQALEEEKAERAKRDAAEAAAAAVAKVEEEEE